MLRELYIADSVGKLEPGRNVRCIGLTKIQWFGIALNAKLYMLRVRGTSYINEEVSREP